MSKEISSQDIQKLLKEVHNIAIVGLSNEPGRDSYRVALYLQEHGYHIIPVNPKYAEILGEKSYPSLLDILEPVDIVDVFRRADAVLEIAQATLSLSNLPKCFWMQLGIHHENAATMLESSGIMVIQDKCIKQFHMEASVRS